MPKYFFHILDGEEICDPEGDDLADDTAARQAGLDVLAEVLLSRGPIFWKHQRLEVRVEAEDGRDVVRVEARTVAERRSG